MSESRRGSRSQHLSRVNYQIDELFQTMLLNSSRTASLRGRGPASRGWRPAIDVYETEGDLHVVAEIAGVHEDQISVSLDDDILRIRGERTPVCDDPERSIHEMGIPYGPFGADIRLPFAVDHDAVEALYENGMLHIRLSRVAPTQISVNYNES